MLLCIISLSSGMNDFYKKYGNASCPIDDKQTIGDRIDTYLGWNYLSGGIIVCCIIGLIASIYLCWYNKPYIIPDQNDIKSKPSKDIEDWEVTKTRYCCIFNIILWVFILLLVIIWWCIMITVYDGVLYVSNSVNCTDDDIPDYASKKVGIFVVLFIFCVPIILCVLLSFCALCCSVRDALCVRNDNNDNNTK